MTNNNRASFTPCPDNIAVIGGGRWARVLTRAICDMVPLRVTVSSHSLHNADSMRAWAYEQGLKDRLRVVSEWPQPSSSSSNALIVVNAARDHERAVERGLSMGIPVLVEKPVTLTGAASQYLVALANHRGVRFAAAHIFLFAGCVEKFSSLVLESNPVRAITVHWMDPKSESRYGEKKQYDPGLPVFVDCLPHVLSIVSMLMPGVSPQCERLEFRRGGAHLEIELKLNDVLCNVQLERNGDQRRRFISVSTEQKTLQLDFSTEPGSITCATKAGTSNLDWVIKKRPSTRMLAAFLQWAAGGKFDNRLNIEIGLQANRVIDQISDMYNSTLIHWLVKQLRFASQVDDDLRYALSELLQSEGVVPMIELEQKIDRLRRKFSIMATDMHWARRLAETRDLSMLRGLIA